MNKWMLSIVDKRIAFSNELKMHITLDSEIVKEVASGGDRLSIRNVCEKEVQKVNQSTLFCMCNDVGRFSSFNDDMANRLIVEELNNTFKTNPAEVTKPHHRLADTTIKAKFKSDADVQDALVWVMIDSYKEFRVKGHVVPQLVKDAVDRWVGNESSLTAILSKRFDITMDDEDYVSADVVVAHLKKNGVTMSKEKIGRVREELGFKRLQRNVGDKRPWCWIGLKEKDFADLLEVL
jgi:phage/plasmid-associated DNA primase